LVIIIKMSTKKKVDTKKVEKPFECIRCGLKADTVNKMQTHIDRKTQCKVSDTGLDIDITKYKTQILNHTFENMLKCLFCNEFFDDQDTFVKHKMICDKEAMKKIATDDTGSKKYCERCHKTFKFKDPEHTVICNETLKEYKKMEEDMGDLEEEVQNLRMLNRRLNEELLKFVGIVNKCIDDYVRTKESFES